MDLETLVNANGELGTGILIFIMAIALMVTVILTIIPFLISNKKEEKNDEKAENIFTLLKMQFGKHFMEEEFPNDDERKWTTDDIESFASYDYALATDSNTFSEYDSKCENIYKFLRTQHEKEKKTDIYLYDYKIPFEGYGEDSIAYNRFAVLTEVNCMKRFFAHIYPGHPKEAVFLEFDMAFCHNKEHVMNFDKEYAEEYCYTYTKQYHGQDFMNKGDSEYLELPYEVQKALVDIYNKTKLEYTVILEKGVLRVVVKIANSKIKDYEEQELAEKINLVLTKVVEEMERI